MTKQPFDKIIEQFLLDNVKPSSRVLDVGCGTGWTALLLHRKRNCDCHGIDVDELKLHRANKLFLKAKRDHLVHCTHSHAEQLSQRMGRSNFDYVVSNHSLHHYSDALKALREIKKALKPDGKLLLSELDIKYGETIDDCPRYRQDKIMSLLRDAGFTIEYQKTMPPGVHLFVGSKNHG